MDTSVHSRASRLRFSHRLITLSVRLFLGSYDSISNNQQIDPCFVFFVWLLVVGSLINVLKFIYDMNSSKKCRFCNAGMEAGVSTCPTCYHSQGYQKEIVSICITVFVLLCVVFVKVEGFAFVFSSESIRSVEDRAAETANPSSLRVVVANRAQYLTAPSSRLKRPLSLREYRRQPQSQRVSHAASSNYQGTQFRQEPGEFPFYVAEKVWNPKRRVYGFVRKGMHGSESVLRQDARRYFLSENQRDYPQPESGCGPTALLNLYIWYTKFGLLQESIKFSDPTRYKRAKFNEIDRRIVNILRESRNSNGGTNVLEQVVALDEVVQANSRHPLRIHFEVKRSRLTMRDFLDLSKNYRTGLLSVRPKDRRTGRLRGNHAVLVIRGDTSGKISIANWGEFSHGRLVEKADGQWFIPDDRSQHELRINSLTTLIPFVPKA